VALFTTLFFQLYAHVGAELYDAPGPTSPWQWFAFSAAHAFRAGDVFDAVEALGWGIQPVKHVSPLVGVVVVAYHVVVDVFFLGLVWAGVGRLRESLLGDDVIRDLVVRIGLVAFAAWFITWVVVAFFLRPWRFVDVPLWFVENVLRVVDFADVMESFGLRLHTLPREGVVGLLTLTCRLWIGLGLAVLLTRKRKPPPRRVLTPPGVAAWPYWRVRAGALAGMAAVLFVVGFAAWLVSGSPAESLVAAVKEGPDDRAEAALRALRRMGPSAGSAVEPLAAARADATPAVRDGIVRTLGYLGTSAAAPLRKVALTEPPEAAGPAADGLAAVGRAAAPDLVAVWSDATDDGVKARAEAGIRRLGGDAVGPLVDGFTPEYAHGHYVWLQRLDANWRLRTTTNPIALACHDLHELKNRVGVGDTAATAAAMNQARACGSAARELLDVGYEYLEHKDHSLQMAAAGIVAAAGPAETPKVLARARAAAAKGPVGPGVLAVLAEPRMWTPAVLAESRTLPALLALANQPEGLPVALPHLGQYGPAAAPATPVLIPVVADPSADRRATARAALARISPDWKNNPALNAAAPSFVLGLSALPPAEADELYAAIKPLSDGEGQALVGAVERRLGELEKQYFDIRADEWRTHGREHYLKSLDGVFGPVEKLGPKAKAAVPAFSDLIEKYDKKRSARSTDLVTARTTLALEKIGGASGAGLAAQLRLVGSEAEQLALLRAAGKEAVPYVREQLGGDDRALLFGLKAVAALGRDAEELVPDLIRMFPRSNRRADTFGVGEVWVITELGQALTAVEPAWPGRPEAAAALGEMLQHSAPGNVSGRVSRRVLDIVAAADAKAAPKVAAEAIRAGAIHPEVKVVLDKAAPEWRADPAVKAAAPALVPRINERETSVAAEATLVDLGPAGVEALAAGLDGLSDEGVAKRFGSGKEADHRDRMVLLLKRFDPPAKAATPALLKLVARPKLQIDAIPRVLETLEKVNPGWAADPTHQEARKAAGDALRARANENQLFVGYSARFGADLGPLLTRELEAAQQPADVLRAIARIAKAGPAAKGAVPALAKTAASDEIGLAREEAIDAIGKVGAGDPALVPTLVPFLMDGYDKSRAAAGRALEKVDPKWRTTPAAKALVPAAKGQLTAAEAGKRAGAAEALGLLGAGDATVVTTLCPVVLDADAKVRTAAGKALDDLDPDWRAKPAAKQAATAAVKQLTAPEARKRNSAVGALDVLRQPTTVGALAQMAARETDANTRRYAEEVLGRLRKTP
ncbi:MAG TPA: hypothetical protein VD866_19065, partial [Urbifossiella sp.]|nr:hypothetical protein [Urbifossiella sp.]